MGWLFRFVSATRKDYSLSPKNHQTRLVRCMFLLSMLSRPFVRTGNCQMAAQCHLPMSSLDLRDVHLLLLQGKPSDVENRFGKIGGLFGVTPIVSRLRDLCDEITNRCFDRRQELIAAVLPMIAAQFWWCQLQLSIDFMIHWPKHSLVYFCFKRFTWQLIWAWVWPVWPKILGAWRLWYNKMAQRPGITWRAAAHWVRWLAITSRSGCTRVWMTLWLHASGMVPGMSNKRRLETPIVLW